MTLSDISKFLEFYINLYGMSQEGKSIFWEVIVSVVLS
jgi:hypothetical protein